MANGYQHHYTPDWLMNDIEALLRRTTKGVGTYGAGDTGPLSKEEFKDKYFIEKSNPVFGKRDKLWYKDWTGDVPEYDGKMGAHRGGGWTGNEGEPFYNKHQSAYDKYLAAWKKADRTVPEGRDSYGMVSANPFDRESFVAGIEEAKGIPEGGAGPSESFTALTPEMFSSLRTEYYTPMIEESRESLIDSLISKQRIASNLGGGISGYGQRVSALEGLGKDYTAGVEGIYADVESRKAESLQSIYDVLSQYQEIA